MYTMQIQMEAGGKPEDSFPTTTINNNNELYTNRNAYDYEQYIQHGIDCKESNNNQPGNFVDYSESQLNSSGHHTASWLHATGAEAKTQPVESGPSQDSAKDDADNDRPPAPLEINDSGSAALSVARLQTEIPKRLVRPSAESPGKLNKTLQAFVDTIEKFKRHRRPVNDFFIFCKVHRNIVSAHFEAKATPKENRFITRTLGLWWTLLTKEQKMPYKQQAKKYKNAYQKEFPDYRWGKSKQLPSHEEYEPAQPAIEDVSISSSEAIDRQSEEDEEKRQAAESLLDLKKGADYVTRFKLADETQMGSLNSLMDTANSSGAVEHNYSAAQPHDNNGGQEWRFSNNREEPCANMRQHFLAQSMPKPEQPSMSSSSAIGTARATRTCKGKRYEAFMQQQGLTRQSPSYRRNQRTLTAASARPSTAGADDSPKQLNEYSLLAWAAAYNRLNKEIDQLPVLDLKEFLDQQECGKRRKKPYGEIRERQMWRTDASIYCWSHSSSPVSSKAARKRKSPKSQCIRTPSAETIVATNFSSSPAPLLPVVSPAAASVPMAETPAPTPSTPQTSTVPVKIVGCRKRKAPKEHIIHRHPVV